MTIRCIATLRLTIRCIVSLPLTQLGRTPLMLACSYSKKPDVLDCLLEQLDEQGVKAKTRVRTTDCPYHGRSLPQPARRHHSY